MEYNHAMVSSLPHRRPWSILFLFITVFFSCDNFAKNIGNYSQIVGNHGQGSEITAECGRNVVPSQIAGLTERVLNDAAVDLNEQRDIS